MEKLSSVIKEIQEQVNVQKKQAADLSDKKSLPTISTVLGEALLKTAALFKETPDQITNEDLQNFMKGLM